MRLFAVGRDTEDKTQVNYLLKEQPRKGVNVRIRNVLRNFAIRALVPATEFCTENIA